MHNVHTGPCTVPYRALYCAYRALNRALYCALPGPATVPNRAPLQCGRGPAGTAKRQTLPTVTPCGTSQETKGLYPRGGPGRRARGGPGPTARARRRRGDINSTESIRTIQSCSNNWRYRSKSGQTLVEHQPTDSMTPRSNTGSTPAQTLVRGKSPTDRNAPLRASCALATNAPTLPTSGWPNRAGSPNGCREGGVEVSSSSR